MTSQGMWDMYGNFHYAFDGLTDITEAEVARIIAARKQRLEEKKI